jgi:hypothetical protein
MRDEKIDVDQLVCFMGNHGARISDPFRRDILPKLAAIPRDDLWRMAGMLLYLRSEAEAMVVANYAVVADCAVDDLDEAGRILQQGQFEFYPPPTSPPVGWAPRRPALATVEIVPDPPKAGPVYRRPRFH